MSPSTILTTVQSDPFQTSFLGQLLLAEHPDIAAKATDHLLENHRELAVRYRPQPALKWRLHLEGAVKELAAAAFVDSPAVFHRHLSWMLDAFSVRGVPAVDLLVALKSLEHIVLRTVPEPEHEWVQHAFRSFAPVSTLADPSYLNGDDPCAKLAARMLVAALDGERMAAARIVMDAVRAGLPARDVHEKVITPALREVGRLWHRDQMSIAEEHACTTTMQTILSQLLDVAPAAERNGKTVLTAAVEGNNHEIGLRMVADAYEISGYRSINLGANVPAEDMAGAIRDFRADVIALSATMSIHLRSMGDAIASVKAAFGVRAPKIIVGGGAMELAPEIWETFGADAYARSAWQAVSIADGFFGFKSR